MCAKGKRGRRFPVRSCILCCVSLYSRLIPHFMYLFMLSWVWKEKRRVWFGHKKRRSNRPLITQSLFLIENIFLVSDLETIHRIFYIKSVLLLCEAGIPFSFLLFSFFFPFHFIHFFVILFTPHVFFLDSLFIIIVITTSFDSASFFFSSQIHLRCWEEKFVSFVNQTTE